MDRESLKYGAPASVGMFHWSFLAAPYPIPETLIQGNYREFLTLLVGRWVSQKHGHKVLEVLDTYVEAYKNEGVVRGACEDYRAGATIDIENEKADLVSLYPPLELTAIERRKICRGTYSATVRSRRSWIEIQYERYMGEICG